MTFDTRIALFLLNELVSALRANDPETFKQWLLGGLEDLGKPAVEELLLNWLAPFLSEAERQAHWLPTGREAILRAAMQSCPEPRKSLTPTA